MQSVQQNESFRVKLLTAIVIRQDQKISELSNQVEQLRKEQKKPNMFIDGLVEKDSEIDASAHIAMVKSFFTKEMEIEETINIHQAYRVGSKNPRSMKIILQDPDDKKIIFSNISNLKGKKNVRQKLNFVYEDKISKEKEQRDYYRDLRRENEEKSTDERAQIRLKKGRIYIDNKVVTTDILVPTARDILTLDDSEIEEIHETKIHEAGTHQEDESEFYCYYKKVSSTAEIETGLAKMKIKYGDAMHIAVAYKLSKAGLRGQGYVDDGEEGAGRAMLKELNSKNLEGLAVYTARYYGSKHLSKRRFEIYSKLAKKSCSRFPGMKAQQG